MPPRNLGKPNKAATTKRQLPKGPYGPQTQLATSGWGRGFSTQRMQKAGYTVWYGMVGMVSHTHPTPPHPIPSHPTPPHSIPTPSHPHPTPSLNPPQARGDAVLIPSNAVGDAWVRRALLKVRVTTYYLLPTNHYSSHVLVLATYCMYCYLQLRMVSLSRPRCLRSSSCRSITRLTNVRHVRVLPSETLRDSRTTAGR